MAKESAKPARKRPAESGAAPAAKKHKPGAGKPGKPVQVNKGGKLHVSKPTEAKPAVLDRKERKQLALERKAKRVKNFNLIQEAVQLWEEARRHDTSPAKRSKLIATILSKAQGRMAELAGSHSASRVIQTCAKYGTDAERKAMAKELEPKLLELAKSPYGHFVVSKLITLAPKADLPGLAKHFRGRIGELLRHPAGAHVVDDLWAAADAKLRNSMAAEFYGREYTLFDSGTINNASGPPAHLGDLLRAVDASKRRAVMQQLSRDLTPIMEKGLVDCPLVHRLLAEYLEHAPASLVADAVEYLSGEPLLHMVHTKHGAKAACMVLAYGTAKDRKKAVRAMKGHVGAMARDEWGHLPLITALLVVDDTALLRKTVLPELQGDLPELAEHKYAHRILLHLLHPGSTRHLPPQLAAIASPPQKCYDSSNACKATGTAAAEAGSEGEREGGAAAGGKRQRQQQQQQQQRSEDKRKPAVVVSPDSDSEAEEQEEGEEGEGGGRGDAGPGDGSGKAGRPTSGPLGLSKKDPEVRRKELLGSGKGSMAAALAELCTAQAPTLLRSQQGGEVLLEVCRGGEGGVLGEGGAGEAALAAVHEAVVAAVAGADSPAAAAGGGSGEEQQQQQDEEAEGGTGTAAAAAKAAEPALVHYFASRTLRRLVLASADGGPSGALATALVSRLWTEVLKGNCKQWFDTHAAKVLAALMHCGDPALRAEASAELQPLLPKGSSPEAWAAQFVHGKPAAAAAGKPAAPAGSKKKRTGGSK